ncbi:hypothetical protein EYF80_032488 [Liparis tanakae]|uniref:Uncharacterized protein n=1 Tax=Liparis tanakae TaxID=230148 RepID=A0A4Z2GV31_9TELE|nr:hypothetical protein EYF80_032488 [Liparis tanakae]
MESCRHLSHSLLFGFNVNAEGGERNVVLSGVLRLLCGLESSLNVPHEAKHPTEAGAGPPLASFLFDYFSRKSFAEQLVPAALCSI